LLLNHVDLMVNGMVDEVRYFQKPERGAPEKRQGALRYAMSKCRFHDFEYFFFHIYAFIPLFVRQVKEKFRIKI